MPIDPSLLGKKYGPYTYEVGLEKIREFAVAISSRPLPYALARQEPTALRPIYHDLEAGRASRYGSIVAPPTFCVNFAMTPFLQAALDPALGINLAMLLHGEQEFEFFDVIRPGDVITTVGTLAEIYERAEKDFFVVRCESHDQRGRLLVLSTWTAVVRR